MPRLLFSEQLEHVDTLTRHRGPKRTLPRKTDPNLDQVFVVNTLVLTYPKIERGGLCPPTPLAAELDRGIGEDYTIGEKEKKNVCHE